MINKQDVAIVRQLAARVAEIAALPAQEQKRALWRKLNARQPERPMVMIDQVCWNEMNFDGSLTLQCSDPECRLYEDFLRCTLYQWAHFPVDMVVESFVRVPKAIHSTGYGISTEERVAVGDPTNSVVGHKYLNQFEHDEDLDKLKIPVISHDETETARRLAVAHELFDGLLDVRPWGMEVPIQMWDPIATWMGVEGACYALADRPEFMHQLVGRLCEGLMRTLDQLEEQGLLCQPQSLIHCTGAFTDELPAPGYNPDKPRCKDLWTFGLAQMFSTVSPRMFKAYEVDYASRVAARFGLVYYGCCDPLDGKMNEVRLIPNVRKVSMSPWANQARGAAEIRDEYVFSRKPSPALLAWDVFKPENVCEDLMATRQVCEQHGCPLEYILKDVSTVRYEPQRLFKWAEVAMDVACG